MPSVVPVGRAPSKGDKVFATSETRAFALKMILSRADSDPAASRFDADCLQPEAIDFAPGVASPEHSRLGEEIVYAIQGLLEYQLDGKPPATLKAGALRKSSAWSWTSAA